MNVAAWLTGLRLNEVAMWWTHNFCVISLFMVTCILDIRSCWVPEDIISYPFYDLYSHRLVRRWASIQFSSIWTEADTKEMWDVCDWGVSFSAGLLSRFKGIVTLHRSSKRNGILQALSSAQGHCYLLYTQQYSYLFNISSYIISTKPPSVCTETFNKQISTAEREYGTSGWPIVSRTTMWPQFDIIV